jgi:hypothetical protein
MSELVNVIRELVKGKPINELARERNLPLIAKGGH